MSPEFRREFINRFSHMNDWSEERIETLFSRMQCVLPAKNTMTDKQKKGLENIRKALFDVDQALLPLQHMGLDYTLGIAGGAVYDMLLDMSDITRDFDMIIHFRSMHAKDYNEENGNSFEDSTTIFSSGINDKLTILFNQYAPQFVKTVYEHKDLIELISHIVSESLNVDKRFYAKEGRTDAYVNHSIYGIVKIQDDKLSHPVDLIIAKNDIQYFVQRFDFELCKVFIPYKEFRHKGTLHYNYQKPEEMLEKIIIHSSTIQDIEERTLTMSLEHFEVEHVHYFMKKHYEKLKAKLPDYQLNFMILPEYMQNAEKKEKEDVANYYLYREKAKTLNEKLPIKDNELIKKKKI